MPADTPRSGIAVLTNASTKGLSVEQQLAVLYPALESGDRAASERFTDLVMALDDVYWSDVLVQLASPEVLFELAMTTESQLRRQKWLRLSADKGHAPSQFEYATFVTRSRDKEAWLLAAAKQEYLAAVIALAKFYLQRQEFDKVLEWLPLAAQQDASSARKLAILYWQLEKPELAQEFFSLAAEMADQQAADYLYVLDNFQPLGLDQLWQQAATQVCTQQVQFVATSLSSMVQALAFKKKFEDDKRLQSLDICISQAVWLQANTLDCSANFKQQGRLGCDLTDMSKRRDRPNFTHLVIFDRHGKANVNNGVMYLDQMDPYSVFVHELAHFAGFVDEYALPIALAEHHCYAMQAPNLIHLRGIRYQPYERKLQWQQLAPESGLDIAPSATCDNTDIKSYKPSSRMTFLQYHDVEYIPSLYIALWQAQIQHLAANNAFAQSLAIQAMQNRDDESLLFWQP